MDGGFDTDVLLDNLPFLLDGLGLTFQLTLMAVAGGIAGGTLLALVRISPVRPLSMLAGAYVNIFRSIPLILVIFWFYVVVPKLIDESINAFYSVLIAFIMFESAYYCEIIRAGISSVRRSQVQAAQALGLTQPQVMRYVVLPQAFRNMLPVLLTQSIVMFQDTSLVYVVGLKDFLTASEVVAQREVRLIELFLTAAVVYFLFCFTASRLVGRLRRKYAL